MAGYIAAADDNAASHLDSLGFAIIDVQAGSGTVASVYTDRVARVARETGVDGVDLLAWAMAHEIGHLLLGTGQHAVRGLMRERWSRAEVREHFLRDWSFSDKEGRAMRDALRSRGMARPAQLVPEGHRQAKADVVGPADRVTLVARQQSPAAPER